MARDRSSAVSPPREIIDKVFLFGSWRPMSRRPNGAPDWHTDPIEGVRWPSRMSTGSIDMRGPDRPGDVKHVWEPSRFYHFFDLCAHPEAGDVAARHVSSWIDQNRWGMGVHWDNALEAALRAISWIAADCRLSHIGCRAWIDQRRRFLCALRWHGRFIESTMARKGYNHLIGDAAGLAVLGLSYPAFPESSRWVEIGIGTLTDEIPRQVLDDGGHVERASAYARFVADLYFLAGHVAREVGDDRGDILLQTSERLLTALMQQATPQGDVPGYGDDDGAMVLWTCEPHHRLGVSLALCAAVTGRGDFKHVSSLSGSMPRSREVIAAVLGTQALAEFDGLRAHPPADTRVVLPDAGVAVHRSSWDHDTFWILFKCGEAKAGTGAHAHADNLQILWRRSGWPRLIDPGTPTYNGDQALRESSVSTGAHNTVCVEGQSQGQRKTRFSWKTLYRGEGLQVEPATCHWTARGEIRYPVADTPVTHTRRVDWRCPSLTVTDTLACPGEHLLTLSLLFEGQPGWRIHDDFVQCLDYDFVISFTGWSSVASEPATSSPVYGADIEASRLVFSATANDVFEGLIVCSDRR